MFEGSGVFLGALLSEGLCLVQGMLEVVAILVGELRVLFMPCLLCR